MSSIRFSLINGNFICRFTNIQEEETKSSKPTTIVVVLDESGSMGNHGVSAMNTFKEVHLKFMDPQTRVCVIAFQSCSRLVETTLRDLNPNEFAPYYVDYNKLVPEQDLVKGLTNQNEELIHFFTSIPVSSPFEYTS